MTVRTRWWRATQRAGWPCVLVISWAMLLSGCPAPTDGNAAKPNRLRVFHSLAGPPTYELRWTYIGNSDPQAFTVYESDAALPATPPGQTGTQVKGTARAANIQLTPGTGKRHMRVAAANGGGEEVLSDEYVVDTTMRLAYVVTDSMHSEGRAVYATALDGNEPTRISGPRTATDALFSVWSPDGQHVAMVGDFETAGEFRVYVAAADGSSLTPVSGPLRSVPDVGDLVNGLAWSPDATQLAYNVIQPCEGPSALDCLLDTYVATLSDLNPVLVGHRTAPGSDLRPTWLPDGEHLVFVADPEETGVFELYSALADGSAPPTTLSGTLVAGGNVGGVPTVSLDGQWVAFLADKDVVGQIELYVVPPAGGVEPAKISGPMVAGAPGIEPNFHPVWSPDSTRIAYGAVAETTDIHHSAYYVVSVPPGNPPVKIDLDVCGQATLPTWSPDGTRLLLTVNTQPDCLEHVYTVVPGQAPTMVSGTQEEEGWPMWRSLPYPSPDGARLAYTAGTGLWVAPVDGSTAAIKVSGAAWEWDLFRGPPFWSVDGTRLAFVAPVLPDYTIARLWVTLADGSAEPVDVSGSTVGADIAGENRSVLEASVGWSRLSN